MALPLATTTVTVTRSANDGTVDLVDEQSAPTPVGIFRACIVSPTSRTSLSKGQRVVTSAGFRTDPAPIQLGDILTDTTTGIAYEVLWALTRYELGMGYTYGDLLIVAGAPA